ncbi:DNA-directed RNA polymerase I subunit RPA43 isoform X4 [Coccinella septempunctata]|uniref:DNA-directed RNA polymerase I subunit RPA43 isoform X4 n=1 Tax=Coccinella septempunctata TaxID=41139 RepID=UPI001D07F323|nr:DNA-directed RNA polymerase I subunit RPA43 isoform X4 [Coccinella septempunctata]
MVITKSRVPVSAKILEQLINTVNSCVEVVKKERDVRTLPYHGNKISNAIKEQLNNLIGKFVKDLNGIVLGYKNIKILSEVGFIDDAACLNFPILADFYLFKPTPGKELPAIVTKKSKDHVGCLVYHTFNVSIPKSEAEVNWEGHNVEIGQEIIFRVTFVKLDSRIPYIRGEFLKKSSVNKRKKFDECDTATPETEIICPSEEVDINSSCDGVVKKKKKKSPETESICPSEEVDINSSCDGVVKKKKKKSH